MRTLWPQLRTHLAKPSHDLNSISRAITTKVNPTMFGTEQTNTMNPQDKPQTESNDIPLPLPPPPSEEEASKLDMSSGEATVKMDALGPLVVNQDGTLSRIENWGQMTDLEKRNTLRILGKRNQARQDALKAKGEEEKA
ncbi:hypothetical protein M409DRAFT_57807 [Zasmidium cellare ATCC 36951]|uniref:Uncharacterized protein n=1 Tax=Zasmidium cellare ATCC 36951 TaxID=1080233 RepID=A0A6A6CB51_ZASCE|nr:uncharacterized protein M409DRAFT_57807 [Zasmidium cellare ATCC 36951]KAF2163142.1 hypothetical protein M409DRAFT_57807 [Zasmidium cellare ATCC 36951]